jgi:hypothetical protein
MKRSEIDALKSWVWERAGSSGYRYLSAIAREENSDLATLVLIGGSSHPDLPELMERFGEEPAERLEDWNDYKGRYRAAKLRVLWLDDPDDRHHEPPSGEYRAISWDSELAGDAGARGAVTPLPDPTLEFEKGIALLRSALGLLETHEEKTPPGLYYRGDPALLGGSRRLGVCGTRAMTGEGSIQCRALSERAVVEGWTCLHGGARGIDEVCARTVAERGGRQVFVLGEGLAHARHEHSLAGLMEGQLIVGARPPFSPPNRGSLIQRNRLIAALSEALIVVQTGPSGGSWHNIRSAREFGHPLITFEREISLSGDGESSVRGTTTTAGPSLLSEEDVAEGRRRLLAQGARRLSVESLHSCPGDVLEQRVFEGRHFDPEQYLADMMARLDIQEELFD